MWTELFEAHPRSVGETYREHRNRAFWFAGQLLLASAACALHALVPRLCPTTASRAVTRLHAEMTTRGAKGGVAAVRRATGLEQA